jgi:hypothetical protein
MGSQAWLVDGDIPLEPIAALGRANPVEPIWALGRTNPFEPI